MGERGRMWQEWQNFIDYVITKMVILFVVTGYPRRSNLLVLKREESMNLVFICWLWCVFQQWWHVKSNWIYKSKVQRKYQSLIYKLESYLRISGNWGLECRWDQPRKIIQHVMNKIKYISICVWETKYLVANSGEWVWILDTYWATRKKDGPSEKGGVNGIKECFDEVTDTTSVKCLMV